ncbi:hypothetical protein AUJ14_03445 [Candidatus Micrarchaeota archaeon CG1_02_55_22]|nr:MAG: hypothetical protein AUJ14_03445 [Candidatus Micrarchaeota archaeon CG1_02_55_22]
MEKLVVAVVLLAVALAGYAFVQYPPAGYSALYVNDASNFSVTIENHWPQSVGYKLSVTDGVSTTQNNFSLPPAGNTSYSYSFASGTAVLLDEYGNEYRVQRS